MRHTYRIRYYKATLASFFTQADHFEEFDLRSEGRIEEVAVELNKSGFSPEPGVWIMPGAILEIRQISCLSKARKPEGKAYQKPQNQKRGMSI